MALHVMADLIQGSDEWLEQRRGIVTASVVGRLITQRTLGAIEYACPACDATVNNPCRGKRTGETIKTLHPERAAVAREAAAVMLEVADTDESRGLIDLLATERIAGWTEDTYVSNDMWRGRMSEPIARDAYSEHHAHAAETGFMRRDEAGWSLGYSPDGLVGDNGLIEIKSPRARTHVRTILADAVPAQYMPQCQAGLLVSGREWLDFVSFHGGLPLYVKRVLPDPEWFAAIEAACRNFEHTAAVTVADYTNRVVGLPATERVDLDLELVV